MSLKTTVIWPQACGGAAKAFRHFVPGPARRAGTGNHREAGSERRFLNPVPDCNAAGSKTTRKVRVRTRTKLGDPKSRTTEF